MSEPLTELCEYCGSPDVLDDAWWCDKPLCYLMYQSEAREQSELEERLPLTRVKACSDLMGTKANVWGPPYIVIENAALSLATLCLTANPTLVR